MNDQPRTGDGYRESEETQKDVILDMRLKKFQRDFVETTPPQSAETITRKARKWSPFV